MKGPARSLFVAFLAVATTLAAAAQTDAPDSPPKDCYSVRGEAYYILLGYNHVVTVENHCEKDLQCEVWTNVDPEPTIPVSVQAGESASVTARRSSPASAFTAYGECT